MKLNLIFFCVLFLLTAVYSTVCNGQYIPPKVPDKHCKALEVAVLSADAGSTAPSIIEIKELIDKYPTWTEPRHHLSRILYDMGKKEESIAVLKSSIAIDTNSQLQQLYTLGRLYEEIGEIENAIKVYRLVIQKGIHHANIAQRASGSLQKLEDKVALFDKSYTITLEPMPTGINSKDHEALGRWTVDERSVIFTRLINNQEDLFIASLDETGTILSVQDFPFNTPYNEGGHTISPDGRYLIFTSCDKPDGMGSCDLYLSVFKNGEWTAPVNMGPGFNSPSWDSQPVFGLDGRSIYFASTRPGGFGGSDIWMVRELSTGKWSKPVPLSTTINTSNNEESPFIHFDGRTIYFMRDGDEGIGGYDLYISRLGIDGKWQPAENMRAPINSGADEGALALHPDGTHAMITRKTDENKNDLFVFELPAEFQSTPVQLLEIVFKDAITTEPVKARLEIFEINKTDTIRASQRADESGQVTMTINRNTTYGAIATADGYIMHSLSLPADPSGFRKIEVLLTPLEKAVDKPVVLKNIFFETGSAKLLPASDPELTKLLWTLRDHMQMKIEIHGHTDNVGSDEDNQLLSEARAKSVYQYLIDRGIDSSRLSYKGFGETRPIATNDTDEGRQLNRRTAFVVVGN